MASIIRIKRSSGTNKPASLNWGEMGYVTGIGSYGGVNQYKDCLLYTSPSPRDYAASRMPSSA